MDLTMARRKHTPDQNLVKRRDSDVMLAEGLTVPEIAKRLEVSDRTSHRWHRTFGDMKGPEMKRLKELELYTAQLKRLVGRQALENQILNDIEERDF